MISGGATGVAALIEVLQKIDDQKVYLALGFASLFEYAVSLNLSEANAYAFCAIARKAQQIPEIKTEIQLGRLTVSKARRILPVITKENKTEWITKAETLSKNALERAVVAERPELLKRETIRRIQPDRLSVNFSISEDLMNKIRRVQDILSSQKRKPVKLEESLELLVEEFLSRKDPVRRAERLKKKEDNRASDKASSPAGERPETFKGSLALSTQHTAVPVPKKFGSGQKRKPIPASTKHLLIANSQGQCTYIAHDGRRCEAKRWLDIHRKRPVSKNGTNDFENLSLLCRTHHKLVHVQRE